MSFSTLAPTAPPTFAQTAPPTIQPTDTSDTPSDTPSEVPSDTPSDIPSALPSSSPSALPSATPSISPSAPPTTSRPLECYTSYVYCEQVSTCSEDLIWQIDPAAYSLVTPLECELRLGSGKCNTGGGVVDRAVGSFRLSQDAIQTDIFQDGWGVRLLLFSAPAGGPAQKVVGPDGGGSAAAVKGSDVTKYNYAHASVCPCAQIPGGCADDDSTTTVAPPLNNQDSDSSSTAGSSLQGKKSPRNTALKATFGVLAGAVALSAFVLLLVRKNTVNVDSDSVSASYV